MNLMQDVVSAPYAQSPKERSENVEILNKKTGTESVLNEPHVSIQ